MGEGDVKHMSNHEFVWFLALLFALSGIAGAIVLRLFKHMSLSTIDYREKLSTQELVEMKELQELMEERRYEGRIYAPAGC